MSTSALIDSLEFRTAMSRFPSGVTIVPTVEADGRQPGFTANAFCAVSMDPPLVLVCLAVSAECHQTFAGASDGLIHVLISGANLSAPRVANRCTTSRCSNPATDAR